MTKKKILILGSDGFIGFFLKKVLKKKNLVLSSHSKNIRNIDILKEKKLFNFLKKKKIDLVINLTGQYKKNFAYFKKVSIEGNKSLIKFSNENKIKIIFISSDQVYGDSNFLKKEKDTLMPKSKYGKIKKKTEKLYKNSNINYMIIRLSNVYDTKFQKRGFLSNLLKYFEGKNKNIELHSQNIIRNFIHVIDACMIINKLIEKKKLKVNTVNIGHENKNLSHILKLFENKFNKKGKIFFKNQNVVKNLSVDISLLHKIVNHKYKYNLEKCIKKI